MSEHPPESEEQPIYVCERFGVLNPEEETRMQTWLNQYATRGYRMADRQVYGSGDSSKHVSVVMELVEYDEEPEGEEGA